MGRLTNTMQFDFGLMVGLLFSLFEFFGQILAAVIWD